MVTTNGCREGSLKETLFCIMQTCVNRCCQPTVEAEAMKSLGYERGYCCSHVGMCAHVSMCMFSFVHSRLKMTYPQRTTPWRLKPEGF